MQIFDKLKAARAAASLTQEAVAEALGVSRQTVSNWETGRTYPDILSVVRMSDLYGVSLDLLLKGEGGIAADPYVTYLAESTDAAQSHRRLSDLILALSYLSIWAASLLVFWLFHAFGTVDAIAYSLFVLCLLLPVSTLTVCILIGRWRGGWRLWLLAPLFGAMHTFAEYATFSLANMLAFHKLNSPALSHFLVGTCVALAGLCIGSLLSARRRRSAMGGGSAPAEPARDGQG